MGVITDKLEELKDLLIDKSISEQKEIIKLKNNLKTLQHFIVYCLAFWLNSIFVITFWKMLFNGNPNVLLRTNDFNEFWIEFFLLNAIFFILIFLIIKLGIQYWRSE